MNKTDELLRGFAEYLYLDCKDGITLSKDIFIEAAISDIRTLIKQVAEATKDVTKQRDELREELELCTQSVRKGAMVTSGLTGRTGWKFDIDSNKKAVDEYLKSRDSHE